MKNIFFENEETGKLLLSRNESAVFSELAGEAVILEMDSGVYYSLDPVGTHIWGLMENKISFNDVISDLLDEFSVSSEQCHKDLKHFIQKMLEYNLIIIE